jgi:hypothetical protein
MFKIFRAGKVEPVKKEELKKESFICDICKFEAKSAFGLRIHKLKKHK